MTSSLERRNPPARVRGVSASTGGSRILARSTERGSASAGKAQRYPPHVPDREREEGRQAHEPTREQVGRTARRPSPRVGEGEVEGGRVRAENLRPPCLPTADRRRV